MDESPEESIISHALQFLVAFAFGAWAWVVKSAASKHLEGQDRLEKKVDNLIDRVKDLEAWRRYNHEGDDN